MPIEVICKGCSRKLRVGDESAGKLARCPSCGETFTVPMGPGAVSGAGYSANLPTQPFGAASPTDRWYLKTEDGATYGPAGKAELDAWVAEGRVTGESQLLREGETAWQAARTLYPALANRGMSQPSAFPNAGGRNPYADPPPGVANPYASPMGMAVDPRTGRYVQPHRGGLILTLGVLGFVLCGFLGIAAVVMASEDLKLMAAGRMDPSGKGLTVAGMVCGIIAILMMVLYFIVVFVGGNL